MREITRSNVGTGKLDIDDIFPQFGETSHIEKLKSKMVEQRQITLDTSVDATSIMPLVYQIEQWNREDDESEQILKEYERQTITLFISSPGGEVTSGMALVSAMQQSVTPIMTVCTGIAASMAFLIFISGHMRYSYRNSEFMLHQLSHGAWGRLQDMYETVLWDLKVQSRIDSIILDRTDITQVQLDENRKCKSDWFMYPEEAAELSIIDGIIAVGLTITREVVEDGKEDTTDDTPTEETTLVPSEDVQGLYEATDKEGDDGADGKG